VCFEDNFGTEHIAVERGTPREIAHRETEVVQSARRRSVEFPRHEAHGLPARALLCERRTAHLRAFGLRTSASRPESRRRSTLHLRASGDLQHRSVGCAARLLSLSPRIGAIPESVVTIVRRDPFKTRLVLVALLGLSLRLAYIAMTALRGDRIGGDGSYYHAIAGLLAEGKGFIDPTPYALHGQAVPSAPHPPLWPLMLSAPALVGLHTANEQQLFACLIGTATVVMIGLAGRELAGHSVGLIAAVIAALSPNFWLYERELMSETATLLGTAATLFLAYRFVNRPSRGRAVAVGLGCGLLAITHSEKLLLIGLLLVPLVLRAREVPRRRRLGWALLATAAAIVVVVPWVAYNTARFHEPVFLGTQLGVTVAVTNCDATYSGDHIGFQDRRCADEARRTGRITGALDSPTADRQYLSVGLDYARAHLARVPVVIAAREGRAWNFFQPFAQMRLDRGRGTRLPVLQLGLLTYWLLLVPAVAGAVILRRRGTPVFPLMAFVVIVILAVAVTYGFTRFRASAEVPIALFAAVAIDAAARRMRSGRRSLIEHDTSRTAHDPSALDA